MGGASDPGYCEYVSDGGGDADNCRVYWRENMPPLSSRGGNDGVKGGIGERFGLAPLGPGFDGRFFFPASADLIPWVGTISECCCSGESDEDPARRSKSSRRRLSFLPALC